jgi:hypothetical protein
MAILTVEDVETYMDISLTNKQRDAAEFIVEGLQAELEAYLNRPITQQSFTEIYRVPEYERSYADSNYYYNYSTDTVTNLSSPGVVYVPTYTLYLNNSPVLSVSSVTITASTLSATPVAQEEERDFIRRDYGLDLFNAFPNDKIEVTYTAGLDGENIKVFKLLVLRAAAREMQNMYDDTVGLKDLTTRNTAPLETGFTDRELMSVKKYKRVRVS